MLANPGACAPKFSGSPLAPGTKSTVKLPAKKISDAHLSKFSASIHLQYE